MCIRDRDKITVSYKADQKVKDIFAKYGEEIAKEVLAESVVADTVSGYQKEWNLSLIHILHKCNNTMVQSRR